MKSNSCFNCCQHISIFKKQYIVFNEPLCLKCGDEEIDVWTVDFEGEMGHTTLSFEDVIDCIDSLENDCSVTVQKRKMSRANYLSLTEL